MKSYVIVYQTNINTQFYVPIVAYDYDDALKQAEKILKNSIKKTTIFGFSIMQCSLRFD